MALALYIFVRIATITQAEGSPLAGIALGSLAAFCGVMLNGVVEYNFGDSEILMLLCALMGISSAIWARMNSAVAS